MSNDNNSSGGEEKQPENVSKYQIPAAGPIFRSDSSGGDEEKQPENASKYQIPSAAVSPDLTVPEKTFRISAPRKKPISFEKTARIPTPRKQPPSGISRYMAHYQPLDFVGKAIQNFSSYNPGAFSEKGADWQSTEAAAEYKLLHPELLDFEKCLDPTFAALVSGGANLSEAKWLTSPAPKHFPYVYLGASPVFSEQFREKMISEVQNISSQLNWPLDNKGIHMESFGFSELLQKVLDVFTERMIQPCNENVRLRFKTAFIVGYENGQYHATHADSSSLTFNFCLGTANFRGGSLVFVQDNWKPEEEYQRGSRSREITPEQNVTVPQKAGSVIIHPGWYLHNTTPVEEGLRVNLIIWAEAESFGSFDFAGLPREIQLSIASFCDPKTLFALTQTSKYFYILLTRENTIWEPIRRIVDKKIKEIESPYYKRSYLPERDDKPIEVKNYFIASKALVHEKNSEYLAIVALLNSAIATQMIQKTAFSMAYNDVILSGSFALKLGPQVNVQNCVAKEESARKLLNSDNNFSIALKSSCFRQFFPSPFQKSKVTYLP